MWSSFNAARTYAQSHNALLVDLKRLDTDLAEKQ
jgi:hypothetical protein